MNHSDIEHMAQGFPPSSIGKDHEEVVTFLATSLLAAQQKLDAVKALAGVAGEMNGVVKDGFAEVVAQRDALAAENAALKSIVEPISNLSQYSDIVAEMSEALRPHEVDGFVSLFSRARHIDTPATDAYHNTIRAEGVIMFATKQLAAAGDLESTITLERLVLDAEEFYEQLRSSQEEPK